MITYIRMQNFKSWVDSGPVKLAPLTGFFGTNSSGKSSLLQMLLLLKQTVRRPEVIFFGDENSLVNLGNFHEVIHGHQLGSELHLGIKGKLSHSFPSILEIPFQILDFAFDTTIREEKEKSIIERLQYTSLLDNTKITWKNGQVFTENRNFGTTHIQNCYGLPSQALVNIDIPEILTQFSSMFEELFCHVYYLGPTRVQPQRQYHWTKTHPENIGKNGEEMIDALLSARVRQLKTSQKEKGVTIEERISFWLRDMDLAYSFSLEPTGALDDNDYVAYIQKSQNSTQVTLADMGHGLADLLPLLVHCYYVPAGSTLILEQPGVHLHPMAQAQLADLFLDVIAERNLQILVESHSEHLLTRLQRRIAEKQVTKDQVALYFCRNNDGASTIEELDVTESGEIKNWPENFFGDVMGDMFAMTDAQAKQIAEQSSED